MRFLAQDGLDAGVGIFKLRVVDPAIWIHRHSFDLVFVVQVHRDVLKQRILSAVCDTIFSISCMTRELNWCSLETRLNQMVIDLSLIRHLSRTNRWSIEIFKNLIELHLLMLTHVWINLKFRAN